MRIAWALAITGLIATGCGDDGDDDDDIVYGDVTVDLDLAETGTRATETLIGNLAADAFLAAVEDQGVQITVIGGGGLRCPEELDAVQCEGYVIPAGPVTSAHLEIVMPFDNEIVIKDVTGAALQSTLERSVSVIPSERKGWFLHPSSTLRYEADCNNTAQVVNTDGTVIQTEGARVTSVTVDGVDIEMTATYKIATTAFVASGGDGHVMLGEAAPTTMTGITEREAVASYMMENTPVTPVLDGRITLDSSCDVQ